MCYIIIYYNRYKLNALIHIFIFRRIDTSLSRVLVQLQANFFGPGSVPVTYLWMKSPGHGPGPGPGPGTFW